MNYRNIVFEENFMIVENTLNEYERHNSKYMFFEADEEDSTVSNPGLIESLKNAIQAVIKAAQNMIKQIASMFQKIFLSAEQKNAFKEFEEACAKDPSLKDKKITVNDWRKSNLAYDTAIKEAEKARDAGVPKEKANEIKDKLINGLKAVAIPIGISIAVNTITKNKDAAQQAKVVLDSNVGVMDQLTQSLGKKQARKFKRDIDRAANKSFFGNLVNKLTFDKAKNNSDYTRSTIGSMWRLIRGRGDDVDAANTMKATGELLQKHPTSAKVIGGGLVRAGSMITTKNKVNNKLSRKNKK